MSRGFVKDGDQEEVPVVPPRAFIPKGVVNYVTQEGMEALQREKSDLLNERDSVAGNETDRRVAYNFINAKLSLLEERIASAVLIKDVRTGKDTLAAKSKKSQIIAFGAYASIKIGESSPQTVRIVGADEANPQKGLISHFSPLSAALLGHKKGEGIVLRLPSGIQNVSILDVSYSADAIDSANAISNAVPPAPSSPLSSANAINPANATPPAAPEQPAAKPSAKRNPANAIPSNPSAPITSASQTNPTSPKAPAPPLSDDPNEIFPLVNERGITVGRAHRWQCHDGSKLLHPVVHLHVFNSKGELYLQKRPQWKDIQPGKWDTSVGGHMKFGETPETALKREVKEELGIEDFTPKLIKKYVFESVREKELVHVYKTVYDGPIIPSAELDGGRFFTREEIKANKGKKFFTPNFENEFGIL